jgi:L-proline amide hydrolase
VAGTGGRTWFRVAGEPASGVPLVTLHGGPGATHEYLLSLAALAERGRPVIHYDQLGNGRSTRLPDNGPEFWTVELFLGELDAVLDAAGATDAYHLLGHSWGGMLAAEHAIRQPAGLRSLVIADSPASIRTWMSEAERLRKELPADVQEALGRHEEAGTLEDPEYLDATRVYYERHVCRVVPFPPEVTASFSAIDADPTVYHSMWGPTEFLCTGTLGAWDITDGLERITAPTLVVSGRFDEATPLVVAPFLDRVPNSRWEVFEESSHLPHVEETERYLHVVGDFLDLHD